MRTFLRPPPRTTGTDAGHDLNINPAERLLQPDFAASQTASIVALLAPRLTVAADGRALTPQWSQLEVLADRQSIRLHVRYGVDPPPATVTVSARMFPYD